MAELVLNTFDDFLNNSLFAECFSEIYTHFNIGRMGPRLVNTGLLDSQDFLNMTTARNHGNEESKLSNGRLAVVLPLKGPDAMRIFYKDVLQPFREENPCNRDIDVIVRAIEEKVRQRMEAFARAPRPTISKPQRGPSTVSIDSGRFSRDTSGSNLLTPGRLPGTPEEQLLQRVHQLEMMIAETKAALEEIIFMKKANGSGSRRHSDLH